MPNKYFDQWMKQLDLSYWGTAQHKISPAQFFERQQTEDVVLMDIRSSEEVTYLALPFALHIPIDELPERWKEIPDGKLVATFCSSATRATVACIYLQLQGLDNVRILDAHYNELTAELKPGKIYKRTR